MTPQMKSAAIELLSSQEGYRQFVYTDVTGHLTIGIGRDIQAEGISLPEAQFMLSNDIDRFEALIVQYLPWTQDLSQNRQLVLLSMAFNLGIQGLLQFKDMLSALEKGDYEDSAVQLLDSKAAIEDKERYSQLAIMMREG